MESPGTVVVELPVVDLGAGETVLAAAMMLLPAGFEVLVCLTGVNEPISAQEELVLRMCDRVAEGSQSNPNIRLIGIDDAVLRRPLLHVVASPEPRQAVLAVMAISAVAGMLASPISPQLATSR